MEEEKIIHTEIIDDDEWNIIQYENGQLCIRMTNKDRESHVVPEKYLTYTIKEYIEKIDCLLNIQKKILETRK